MTMPCVSFICCALVGRPGMGAESQQRGARLRRFLPLASTQPALLPYHDVPPPPCSLCWLMESWQGGWTAPSPPPTSPSRRGTQVHSVGAGWDGALVDGGLQSRCRWKPCHASRASAREPAATSSSPRQRAACMPCRRRWQRQGRPNPAGHPGGGGHTKELSRLLCLLIGGPGCIPKLQRSGLFHAAPGSMLPGTLRLPGCPPTLHDPPQAMGRQNFGCDSGNWDFKGLTSQHVTLNGAGAGDAGRWRSEQCLTPPCLLGPASRAQPDTPCRLPLHAGKLLRGWEVFPLQLDDVSDLAYATGSSGAALVAAARRRMLEAPAVVGGGEAGVPTFFRRGGGGGFFCAGFVFPPVAGMAQRAALVLPLGGPTPCILPCHPASHSPAGAHSRWRLRGRCAAPRATWLTPTSRCTAGAKARPRGGGWFAGLA